MSAQKTPHFFRLSPFSAQVRTALAALGLALFGLVEFSGCGAVPVQGAYTAVPVDDGNLPFPQVPGSTEPNGINVVAPTTPDEGAALVWSRDLNQCLGAAGNVIVSGNPVVLKSCDGSRLQQWTWTAGTFRIGSWCMTGPAANAPILFMACDPGNGAQTLQHNYGKIAFINGSPLPVAQTDGTLQLTISPSNAAEAADQRVFLLSSTPVSRGFVVRNGSDSNGCLAVQNSNVQVLACLASDTNQRWTFGKGFLHNVATDTCLAHNGLAGPLGTASCENMNAIVDGFWLGNGGDVPGHAPETSGAYPTLVWDPTAQEPNRVRFAVTELPGRFWRFGTRLP